jgi:hypothetical protein
MTAKIVRMKKGRPRGGMPTELPEVITDETYLNRKQQSLWLQEQGFRISPATLAKWASDGKGARYSMFMGRAYSTVADLKALIAKSMSKTYESAAARFVDAPKAKRRRDEVQPS